MLTNPHTGTTIDEVADGIYRINTPLKIDAIPGGFNLSQYLILDDESAPLRPGPHAAVPSRIASRGASMVQMTPAGW